MKSTLGALLPLVGGIVAPPNSSAPCTTLHTLTTTKSNPPTWDFNYRLIEMNHTLGSFNPFDSQGNECTITHDIGIPAGWRAVLNKENAKVKGYVKLGDKESATFTVKYSFNSSKETVSILPFLSSLRTCKSTLLTRTRRQIP